MCSADEVKIVSVEKLGDNIRSKSERDSSVVLPPALHVLVWVRPEEVTETTSVWDVRRTSYRANLIKIIEIRRQSWRGCKGENTANIQHSSELFDDLRTV